MAVHRREMLARLPARDVAQFAPDDQFVQVGQREQPGTQPIVQVVGVVGDLIGEIGDLRLQRGPFIRLILGRLAPVIVGLVLQHPLAGLIG